MAIQTWIHAPKYRIQRCLFFSSLIHFSAFAILFKTPICSKLCSSSFLSSTPTKPVELSPEELIEHQKMVAMNALFNEITHFSPREKAGFSPLIEQFDNTLVMGNEELSNLQKENQNHYLALTEEFPVINTNDDFEEIEITQDLHMAGLPSPLIVDQKCSAVLPKDELFSLHSLSPMCVPRIEDKSPEETSDIVSLKTRDLQGNEFELTLLPEVALSDEKTETITTQEASLDTVTLSDVETDKIDAEMSLCDQTEIEKRSIETFSLPSNFEMLNDDHRFAIEVEWGHNPEENGYIFTASLSPKFDKKIVPMNQVFHFVIDRSRSIEKHRFHVYKKGVYKALSSLQDGNLFNITFFDKEVDRYSLTPIPFHRKDLPQIEAYLEKIEQRGIFKVRDIYSSLDTILPNHNNNMLQKAIILTDGTTRFKEEKRRALISDWSARRKKTCSIYTAAVGQKNQLMMLDHLSSSSNGSLLYSDTHAAFPRKLCKLIEELKRPIGRSVRVIPLDKDVTILSSEKELESLHADKPITIVGKTKDLENFSLLFQAQYDDVWLNIKQSIEFNESELQQKRVEKKFCEQRARACYSKFLESGDKDDLDKAKYFLKLSGKSHLLE